MVMAPNVKRRYRQPILASREQHATPFATVEQDGRASASLKLGEHEKLGIKAMAMALQMTTPMGWKMDRHARRKRFL
jgi:hypothetical protein